MPKLTDISSRTGNDTENNNFLNKTGQRVNISYLKIFGKLQCMKSINYFDVLNANSAENRI